MQTTTTPTAQSATKANPLFRVFLSFTALVLGVFLTQASFAQTILQENFNGSWQIPSQLSPAWSTAANTTAGANGLWAASDAPTSATGWSSTTGGYTPAGANSSARSARFHDYDCPAGGIGELYSPVMNFSTFAGEKAVSFFHINTSGTDVIRFAVSLDGGATWGPNLLTLGVSAAWTQYIVPIGNTTSSTVMIKFRADGTFGGSDIGIDEVNVFVYNPTAYNYSTTASGGLWSSPATWVGGVVPPQGISNITIPAGSIVTVDQIALINTMSLSGVLQWNATATNTLTTSGNFTINSGGRLHAHTTAPAQSTITVGGNFINNGYANMAIGGSLTMNGAGSYSISGTGTFEGDGTRGIIRTLGLGNSAGTYSINTSQDLTINTNLSHLGGALNTNGKLRIDNTVNLFGRPINTSAANVVVTTMGSAYTSDPVVTTPTVNQWTSGAAGSANSRYFNAGNIYLLTSGTTQGTTAPTHTSGTANNFLWLCSSGTLGTLYLGGQSHTAGTQYVYGDNLYLCTVTGNGSATTGPTHTSGSAVVNAATFVYVGQAIKVSVNRDATTSTIRSLNLVNAGSGYAAAPAIVFTGGGGSGAAATVIVPQSVGGSAYFPVQKSGEGTVTGGLTINSDQGVSALSADPQASSGVGSVFCTNGGVNYTIAPQLGFSGPTALNLVTNGGSGYTAAPTLTITGGTQPVGATAYAAGDFTITMNQGKVVSIYLTNTTKTYITPPTITLTGNATAAFPTNCWPAATANIGANRQLTSFTVTNSGFGYVAPPTVAVGNASATTTGGTYTTAASGFTSRIAAYYIRTAFFTGASAAGTQQDDAYIPASRKMHGLWLNGNDNGAKLTGNLTLISGGTGTTVSTTTSPSPLILTASGATTVTSGQTGNVLDMGGNNLYFSWNGYTGTTSTQGSTNAYVRNGSITLTGRGGGTSGSTFNFPFLGTQSTGRFQVVTGTGTGATNGADILTVKVTERGAPGNTTSAGANAIAIGKRAYRVETTTIGGGAGTAGTNPTVGLHFNMTQTNSGPDSLTTTQDQTFVAEAPTLNGAWTVRSAAVGASGALATNAALTSVTTTPGPIALVSGNHYAFATTRPTITDVSSNPVTGTPQQVCANSGNMTITGTNLTGVTAVRIGTEPVTSFTIVSATQINFVAGNQTSGVVTLEKAGGTVSGTQTITWTPAPAAPSISATTPTTILTGQTVGLSATTEIAGAEIRWYNQATGGSLLGTGSSFTTPQVCRNSIFYAAVFDGSCEGVRSPISITVTRPSTTVSKANFCGTGGLDTLSVTPSDPSITYTWTNLNASATFVDGVNTGSTVVANVTATAEFRVIAETVSCKDTATLSVGVYPLPSATVTTTASGVCPGTSATIGSGLSAGNFSAACITPQTSLSTPPANATTLILNGVAQALPSGVSYSNSLDDGKFGPIPMGFNFNFFGVTQTAVNIGTNGVVNFGSYAAFSGSQYIFTGGFPAAANPASTVAVCARDLRFGTPAGFGSLRYWTEGIAPNRRFIVQYENVPIWSGVVTTAGSQSGFNNVEAVFYETLGTIDIRVISATNGTSTVAAEINKYIGLQDATKTVGATAPNCSTNATNFWNGVSNAIGDATIGSQAWRFSPPSNYTVSWFANGTQFASGTNIFSQAVAPTTTTLYSISYTNQTTGCTNEPGSAQVNMVVLPNTAPAGVQTLLNGASVSSAAEICAGDSRTLSLDYSGSTDGLSFQWQRTTNGGTNWLDIASATTTSVVVTPDSSASYRCRIISCGGTPAFSSTVTINFQYAVATTTGALRCGPGTVNLEATVPTGVSLRWWAAATGGTTPAGTGSPFTTPSINTTTQYWAEAFVGACSGARVPVTATVNPAPALTIDSALVRICAGNTSGLVSLTAGASDYDQISWTPSTGVTGSVAAGWTFNPTATTTYTLNASQSAGICSNSVVLPVTVNARPVIDSVRASATAVCTGNAVTLTAYSGGFSSGSQIFPSGYCTVSSLGLDPNSFFNSFSTTGGSQNISNTSGYSSGGYGDFTNLKVVADAGTTINFSTGLTGTTVGVAIWVDWNRNGSFETTERVYNTTSYVSSASGSFTVPLTASAGLTRMRIMMDFNTANPANPCAVNSFGRAEVEDYAFNVNNVVIQDPSVAFTWNPGALSGTSVIVNPAVATTYTVSANNTATGCAGLSTSSISISINPPAATPTAQPTALVLQAQSNNGVVNFTPASPAADRYLVLRSATQPTDPVDGVVYTVGATELGATVVGYGLPPFNDNGLDFSTSYTYWVYAVNGTTDCAGPKYLTVSPVSGTLTTCPSTPVAIPGTPTSSAITATGFTASWTASSTPDVTYILDVATNNTFTSFVAGYQGLNTGTATSQAISGLSPTTAYFVRVRALAPGNCLSANSGTLSVTTPCVSATIPFSQGFNATSAPSCWTNQFVSGTSVISFVTQGSGATGGTSPVPTVLTSGGTHMVAYNSYTGSGSQSRLISTPFTTVGVSAPSVQFQWYFSSSGGSTLYLTEGVVLQYSLNGSTWTNFSGVDSFIRRYGDVTGWSLITRPLPAAILNQPIVYLGLLFTSNAGYDAFLDNFAVLPQCTTPASQPTSLNFPSVGSAAINGSFTAAAAPGVSGYLVLRTAASTTPDTNPVNGTVYTAGSTLGNATVVSAGAGTTFSSVGLSVSTTYRYTLYSYNDNCAGAPFYNTTSPLSGEATTLGSQNITSTGGGGLWSQPATWSTGFVPSINDNVTITNGNPVTIDIAAFAASLVVGNSASLTYEATNARTLTVNGDVTVSSGATFATAATGTVTTHVLRVSGNLTNNGTLDFNTNTNTAGGRITFADSTNSAVTFANNGTTDIRTMTIDKGSSTARSVEMTGSGSITAAAGFLTLTNGMFKVSANMGSNTFFGTAAYTIGATTGFWLNNASTTVSGQNGSPTNNGQLRISAGTYNVGTASDNSMGAGTGAIFNIEGGSMNVSGRLTSANNVSYTQSGGTVTVSTFANTSTTLPSFGFTSGNSANVFNMSGGSIVLQTPSSGIDYNQGQGTVNISGGTLQFGNSFSSNLATFVMSSGTASGQMPAPSIVVGTAGRAAILSVAGSTGGNINVFGSITVNSGSTLSHNHSAGQDIIIRGNSGTPGSITNNGTISLGGSGSINNRIQFNRVTTVNASPYTGASAHGYSGTGNFGISTAAYPCITLNSSIGLTIDAGTTNQLFVNRINAFHGAFTNANKITLGQGVTGSATIQRGNFDTLNAGTFDQAPVFNVGTGGLTLTYANSLDAMTTSFEVPASRTINTLTHNNSKNLTLAGGNLSATTVNLNAGNLVTDASNKLTVTGTTTTSIARGSYTSATGATSSGAVVNVVSTTGLRPGMNVSVSAGTGAFAAGTKVDSVLTSTTFRVTAAPTTALASATVTADGGWVSGPLTISLPTIAAGAAATTYRLPIGKTAFAGFDLVNPVTNAAATVTAEYFTEAIGGSVDLSLLSLENGYWQSSADAGFDSARIRVNRAGIDVGQFALAKDTTNSVSGNGVYSNVGTNGISTTQVASNNRIPLGFFAIGTKQVPMTYTSISLAHPSLAYAYSGTNNVQILRVNVLTANNFPALVLNDMTFSSNGSTGSIGSNVTESRLYYTGNSSTFSTATQVGSNIPGPSMGTNFTFTQDVTLAPGNNYFWLVYDVPSSATTNDSLDATCESFTYFDPTLFIQPTLPLVPPTNSVTGKRTIKAQLNGDYFVGPTETAPNFTSLTSAVTTLNDVGVSGPVRFLLQGNYVSTGETSFPITINQFAGSSATNTVTIMPNTGVTAAITAGTSSSAVFKLNGADNVIIDGSNNGTTSRNLTLTNPNTATSGNGVVWVAAASATDGATNNIIRNLLITGNSSTSTLFGIYEGATSSISLASGLANNTGNTYQNNLVSKVQYGVFATGVSSTSLSTGLNILNNVIGNTGTGNGVSVMGIGAQFTLGANITGNTVQNQANTGAAGITDAASQTINIGIYSRNNRDLSIIRNNVTGMNIGGSSVIRSYAISVESPAFNTAGSPSNALVANNTVSDIRYTGTGSSTWQMSGINDNGGFGDRFYYNSVYLSGAFTTTSGPNAAFSNGNAGNTATCANIDVRNNIFYVNVSAAGTTSSFFAHHNRLTSTTGSTINNNNVKAVVAAGSGTAHVGYFNGSNRTTFANWRSAIGVNTLDRNADPVFVSTTDLHLSATAQVNLDSLSQRAAAVGAVTTDFDGETRSATTPTIGADELVPCAGAIGGTAVAPATTTFCGSSAAGTTITASGYSSALGGTYQWESSNTADFSGTVTTLSGATNPASYTISPAVTATTYFRLRVNCNTGTAVAYSNVITITIASAPTASITATGGNFYCNPVPQSITLNAVTDLVSPAPVYQWKLNGTAISGETGTTLNPNGSLGSYTLDVTNTTTNCTTTSAATVVGTADRPSVPTVSGDISICSGGAGTSITASSTSTGSGSGTIGTGTVSNTLTSPYKGFWGSNKSQFMYTVAELTAAGLGANSSITSIQLPVSSFTGPYTFNGFRISMKNSGASSLTSSFETGMSTVFGPTNYTLSGTAPFTVTHNLTTPFIWNGTSNLVVEFCFDNNDGGGVSANTANVTSSTITGYAVYNSVDNSGGTVCESGSGITSTTRVNMSFNYSTSIPSTISWSPSTGLSATTGSPVTANPTSTQLYTATATSPTTGCTSTNTMTVTVNNPPSITTQPVAPSAFCAGSGSQQLSVVATGGNNLTYSWRKNGVAVSNNSVFSGQGTATLTIASPSVSDAGSYTVVVGGCSPSVTSDAVTVTVNALPSITTQPPASQALCLGASDSLSVVATGTGISYSWRKNGVAITNNAVYSGQGTAQLNFTNPSAAEAGTYDVVISGTCTPSVTSTATTVTVNNINTFSGTGNWTNVGNWSCDRVPLSTDNIEIGAGAVVTLNTNLNITGTLNMNSTARMVINPTRELAVASGGTVNLNGASVTLKSTTAGTAVIGRIQGTLSGASNVTIERFIPVYDATMTPSHVKAWRLLSVPTYTIGAGGQTIRQAWQENGVNNNGFGLLIEGQATSFANALAAGFDTRSVPATIQRYSGTSWVNVTNTNATKLDTTGAYFLFVRGNRTVTNTTPVTDNSKDVTLRTTGNIYQGSRTVTIPAAASNFSVVGNIYPSPVNFTTLLANSTNINSAFHLWDAKRRSGNSLGGYQYFSATNSYGCTPCGGSFPNDYQNTTIQSGQGFFVQRTTTASPASITFTEAAKVSGLNINNLGFRPATPASELVKIDSRLYAATGTEVLDGNTVVFSPNYSNGVDGDDAIKMSNFSENFGIQKGEVTLAVEGRQPLTERDTIFFRIWNLQEQEYKLEFTPRNLATSGLTARLEDTHLGTSVPMDLNGVLNHNFTVDATPGSSSESRFRIVFAQSGGGPLPVTFISVGANMLASGNVQVDWKVAAERNIRRYEVESSADGRVFAAAGSVAATGNNIARDIAYNWIDPTVLGTTRFYRVKSVGVAGEVRYSSIVKVSRSNVKPSITVSPNPVEGGVVNLQFKNKPEGRYNVNLVGNDGKVIFTAPAVHPGGNSTQLINLPVAVARGAYQFEIIAPDNTREVMTLLINTNK